MLLFEDYHPLAMHGAFRNLSMILNPTSEDRYHISNYSTDIIFETAISSIFGFPVQ
jgi:hypothetical protein